MTLLRHSRIAICSLVATLALLGLIACTGPEPREGIDPTATPTATATPTEVPPTPTNTPEPTSTPTPSPTPEPTATPTLPPATPTVAATATADASPTVEATEPPEDAGLAGELPTLEELDSGDFEVISEGTRSAQDLANAYADPGAHLQRLQDWGFQQHVYREFLRVSGAEDDPAPDYILATVNEYGSPEQAEDALIWLFRMGTTQGATEAEAPEIGDNAVAITVPTVDGVPTASIYVRREQFIYIYFAQGGDPLPKIREVAERVFSR